MHSVMCDRIFTTCTNLIRLTLQSRYPISFNTLDSNECTSSILIELNINVSFLSDCLYLLDGRLPQLKTFRVKINHIEINLPELITDFKMVDIFKLIIRRTFFLFRFLS
jgi:hypothetical protein